MAEPAIQQALKLATQHHQAGRLGQAEQMYRQVLAQQPNHPGALHLLGVLSVQAGRSDRGVELIGRAVALRPNEAVLHGDLGNALRGAGRGEEAIAAYRRAIALKPGVAQVHYNLGNALKQKGQLDEAIAAYRQAIALKGDFAEAHANLGNALKDKGQMEAAIAAYGQAIALRPGAVQIHYNLGNALMDKGRLDEAVTAYGQAIALKGDFAEAYCGLGNALRDKGQLDEAVAACRRSIVLKTDFADAHRSLGTALQGQGQLAEAVAAYRQAIALQPGMAGAYYNLGNALKEQGKMAEAMAAYRQAIALQADFAAAHCNLGNALRIMEQLDEAVVACEQAVALGPDLAEVHCNLGNALMDQGRIDEAVKCYRRAIAVRPDYHLAHSNLIGSLQYHPAYDAAAIADELRHWNRRHAEPLRPLIEGHLNDHDPERRLRIGYVSADFRNHASAYFLVPLLERHDPNQVELFCYAEVVQPDEMTCRMQRLVSQWRTTVNLSDDQVARQIRADQIDILVDLKLHTDFNRLLVFARHPAPVQVTWLGYPGSTGLPTIDYRLTDPYLDPPGLNDAYYSEQSWRLGDTFWCYDPLSEEPPVNALPAVANGWITFGCLNNFCKLNEPTLRLWSQVLRAVDRSHLVLLTGPGSHRQRTLDLLHREGISPERVEFFSKCPRAQYLKLYHGVDVALDSFPYNGHTTSLDAYWMGVPVVTLVGSTAVSRAGWSQLSNLGLTELAAQGPDEFVEIVVKLAGDLPRLRALRAGLRQRMRLSPLMDAPRFARNVEAAYRQMWRNWCQRDPAEA